MRAHDRKLRLALAVFEAPASLRPGVAALLQEGIPLARIGLIVADGLRGLPLSTETASASPGGNPNPLAVLVENLQPLSDGPQSGGILASPWLLDLWHAGLHRPALWAARSPAQSAPRLAADLERHVRAGSVILAVESLSLREQWWCTRVLLQQSSSSVLALECSLPPSEAGE